MTEVFQIAGMTFCFSLAFVMLRKSKFLFLGLTFICCGFILLETHLWTTEYIKNVPFLAEVFAPLSFSIPVWLFMGNVKSLTQKIRGLLLVIPILPYLNFLPLYTSSIKYKQCYIQYEITDQLANTCQEIVGFAPSIIDDKFLDFILLLEFVLLLFFLRNKVKDTTSSERYIKSKLVWNKWNRLLFNVIIFALICTSLGIFLIPDVVYFNAYFIPVIGLVTFIFMLNNSTLFQDFVPSKSYSRLSETEVNCLYQKIENTLNKENYYSNSELTLAQLANNLEVSINKLSFVLNHNNTSFKTLLNCIRIKKAADFMKTKESQNYSIEGIAGMFGYKSKSTFYLNFKKFQAKTPKEFMIAYKNSLKT